MSVRVPRPGVLSLLIVAACAAAGALAAPQTSRPQQSGSHTTMYRWVDDQGVIHYGDQIPPQYANKDREEMNSQGVPVRHFEGAKSPEQAAAEARDRAAMIRQKQHDAFLVTTYTSVKDIESLRDSRLEQLKSQRAAAQQYIESLKARLGTLQERALTFSPYKANARPMPDDVAEDLVHTVNELHTQVTALASEREQESKLREEFQADIERYRELHTLHTSD